MFYRIAYLLTALAIITPWFFFERNRISPFEIRYYVALLITILIVLSFGVLRMYNAMVQNTAYLGKTAGLLHKFVQEVRKVTAVFTQDTKKVTTDLTYLGQIFKDGFKKFTDDFNRAINQMESNRPEKRADKD